MKTPNRAKRTAPRGFTLIELLIVVAILFLLAAMAIPAYLNAMEKARRNALVADARVLFQGFIAYSIDQGAYPPCCNPPAEAFVKDSLWPLTRYEYISNPEAILGRLQGGAVTDYDSPDQPSENHDFYALLIHDKDPQIQVLVADTDEYPGHQGTVLYGLYLVMDGTLTPISDQ